MNLIGDIQGNYATLLALLNKMPDEEPVSVGDMVDRGPRSREVLLFFQQNGRALLGNHEHMMLDYFRGNQEYPPGLWMLNGGGSTLESMGLQMGVPLSDDLRAFLGSLPLYIRDGELVVTHAPIHARWGLEHLIMHEQLVSGSLEQSVVWNREDPVPREGVFQVFGHNGYRYVRPHFFQIQDRDPVLSEYAVCIDTVRGRILSGMHWPSRRIYMQEILD